MLPNKEERQSHPGWAIKFANNTWLCIAHGVGQADDAFYAKIWATQEEANRDADFLIENKDFPTGYWALIPAWEPLCENLRHQNISLTEANKISPSDIMDITFDLENVISLLKHK